MFSYRATKAVTFNCIHGDYAEFGCHQGVIFTLAWQKSRRHRHDATLWAFDSFAGLPAAQDVNDDHQAWRPGKLATTLPEFQAICPRIGILPAHYRAIPGFYGDSLGALAAGDQPVNIALAHLDCYLYSSTSEVLKFLLPRLKHGLITAFGDYFCWSAERPSGERQAMLEHLGDNDRWHLLPYVQFGWHGQSFVVGDQHLANRTC
jgi:hypothetical protein